MFTSPAPLFRKLLFTLLLGSFPVQAQSDPDRPVATSAALPMAAAAAAMKVPEGFSVEPIVGEPDVVQPIAYTLDDRGRLWVVENTNYPNCPGEAKDRVLVLESTNNDGKFDKKTVFWDKATFTSGLAVGFGGVWLGSPPNLLFIPDRNGDAVPDGAPQIVLDGWGNQDTHETFNDFIWGPDGWLYGTQGIFTESHVGKPGSTPAERVSINAGVWRYHPTKKLFERWAEGVSNQWGLDWNDQGEAFFAACVISHMWHGIQGAHYERQAGKHDNPHLYGDIQTIAWGRYEKAAYCGGMIYLGGAFPEEWRNRIFFHDIHMNKMRCEELVRDGSGYRSVRKPELLSTTDAWFRGLSPQYGPDGGVFLNDWYDKVPCHQQKEFTDRSNGRIYKIVNKAVQPVKVDLEKASDSELVQMQLHQNDWYVRHARRLLQERGANSQTTEALEKVLLENPDDTRQLRALWTLHVQGALAEPSAIKALDAKSEHVRAWTITCIFEDGKPTDPLYRKAVGLARSDPSPLVRLRMASAAQRMDPSDRWELLDALASHQEDEKDRNLPLMIWYAAEPSVASDPVRGVAFLNNAKITKLHEFISRRITSLAIEDSPKAAPAMEAISATLAGAASPMRQNILWGMLAAVKGRATMAQPGGWEAAYQKLKTDNDSSVRSDARTLALVFGSKPALDELRAVLDDPNAKVEARIAAIEVLAVQRDLTTIGSLVPLLTGVGPLRSSALRALAVFDDARIAPAVISIYPTLDAGEKREALNTLTSRVQATRAFLAAIDANQIERKELTAPVARVIQGFKDKDCDMWLQKNWGSLKASTEDKQKEMARYKQFLSADAILRADLDNGRGIFLARCAVCHTMFGKGGKIGPELPGSFADMDYLLQNILDPNAVIGKDYQQVFITTKSGELKAGVITAEDPNSVTLKTLAAITTIPRAEIKSTEISPNSMMPEGVLTGLEEPQIRDLFLYLRQASDPKK